VSDHSNFVITVVAAEQRPTPKTEICEHKGIGHPDSICDGVAEAVSRALALEYLRAYGKLQHYNVDKALLIAGESAPRFGGGKIIAPIRLILAGRVSPLPRADVKEVVCEAARDYLTATLRCNPDFFLIESALRGGSASLRRVFSGDRSTPVANDTSFGAAYAPYSRLDQVVLRLSEILRSAEFRAHFPTAGDDYKIMGFRVDQKIGFTIALAFVDRRLASVSEYFDVKADIRRYLGNALLTPCEIELNMLDDPAAVDESGIYLTVTGLSAEHGDDGEVGRGNRTCGLITPGRTMSLEAAAGKNPVAHVGKIYNALSLEMARAICAEVEGIAEASVQILSTIGRPIAEPRLVAIEVVTGVNSVLTLSGEWRKSRAHALGASGKCQSGLFTGRFRFSEVIAVLAEERLSASCVVLAPGLNHHGSEALMRQACARVDSVSESSRGLPLSRPNPPDSGGSVRWLNSQSAHR
jgi:S-adenosylmethionine synthetase